MLNTNTNRQLGLSYYLNERSKSGESRLDVLVLPSPVKPAHGSAHGDRAIIATSEPLGQLAQLSFAQRSVLLSVEDSGVVRSMNFPVVLLGEISKSHKAHDVQKGVRTERRLILELNQNSEQ